MKTLRFSHFPFHRRRIRALPQGELGLRGIEAAELLEVSLDGILKLYCVSFSWAKVRFNTVTSLENDSF